MLAAAYYSVKAELEEDYGGREGSHAESGVWCYICLATFALHLEGERFACEIHCRCAAMAPMRLRAS